MKFTFNGKHMRGLAGDTLAASLLANGRTLLGRSFKYHRPRGIVASGAEEPNALVGLGKGDRYEPNQRVTTTELFDGLSAETQNHWPSLDFDLLAVNSLVPQFLTAGFYYKTFLRPRAFWKHVYEPFIRKSAGLGQGPRNTTRATPTAMSSFTPSAMCWSLAAGLPGCKPRCPRLKPARAWPCGSRPRIGAGAPRSMA